MAKGAKSSATKQSANLSVNSELLRQAKELNINLSQALEQRLAELVRQKRAQRWLQENRKALEDYNRLIDRRGVFSDGLRRF